MHDQLKMLAYALETKDKISLSTPVQEHDPTPDQSQYFIKFLSNAKLRGKVHQIAQE